MIFKVKFPCCHTLGSSSFSFACSKGRPTPTPTCRCFWGAAAATKGCKLINENAFIHASDDDGVWSQNRFELEFRFVYETGHDWQLMLLYLCCSAAHVLPQHVASLGNEMCHLLASHFAHFPQATSAPSAAF